MTSTSDVTAKMMFASAMILAEHSGGLRARELWPLIVERLPGVEQEWDAAKTGKTTAEENFRWYSIDLVKAGWIHKTNGRWYLTAIGRKALDQWPEPVVFFRTVRGRYTDWDRNKERYELAKRLISTIPEGTWASAAELAQETDLHAERLVQWLQGERPEGWHRVLAREGHVPTDAPAGDPEREQWLALLAEDGIDTSQGRADPLRRIPGTDLEQLVIAPIEGDEKVRRAWLVRGSNVQGENLIRTLWLPQGVCSMSARRLRELPAGASAAQVRTAIDEDYAHAATEDRARLAAEYHAFLSRMREGDIVLTNDGAAVFIGAVTGPPSFVASVDNRANLQRTVDWRNPEEPFDYADDLPDEISTRLSNPDAELIELTEFIDDLEQLAGEQAVVVSREIRLPEATDELSEALLIDREWLQECVELLRDRPQLIFYGPPGTGKTYLAQHLAEHLTGGKPENVQLVQFHPAYSYEDFFEGYRPRKAKDGTVSFDLVRGPFSRIARAAEAHPGEPFVLIIDEINRGNLARIFGELYFLLEYRGKSVNLLYGSDEGKGFSLPRNLLILGTMNTADRSIALVDAAMRRRFWFVELHPDEPPTRDMLERWLGRETHSTEPARLLAELNRRIEDRDFRIGPSYLMRESAKTEEGLQRIWRMQILPLLEEHHYGDGTDVKQTYGLDALRAQLG